MVGSVKTESAGESTSLRIARLQAQQDVVERALQRAAELKTIAARKLADRRAERTRRQSSSPAQVNPREQPNISGGNNELCAPRVPPAANRVKLSLLTAGGNAVIRTEAAAAPHKALGRPNWPAHAYLGIARSMLRCWEACEGCEATRMSGFWKSDPEEWDHLALGIIMRHSLSLDYHKVLGRSKPPQKAWMRSSSNGTSAAGLKPSVNDYNIDGPAVSLPAPEAGLPGDLSCLRFSYRHRLADPALIFAAASTDCSLQCKMDSIAPRSLGGYGSPHAATSI
ncbi:hypothetical protein PHYSODRAFT_297334 [Phytophthora sojae]|uniref:Uncharacterized protein n=1 Tax=Phytophthora sojae (strain P6497) TaxID=1094619 RepID=G4Z0I5_PHYSP|nr:hypothetical protein PHYSODRAFT_297334 [Phytophthora sojae]EGZ25834.1 hypothetical protein PHYSODRAFT_297334 [Phytophthora sojae]|eukprot:XP_009521122.1 hypothetical protein PHYSODRAFT_297334 [Phytophthora sojae]